MTAYTMEPTKDCELWCFIHFIHGGIRRDEVHWDRRLTVRENRREWAFLDRSGEKGTALDSLAAAIGEAFPWFGIQDSDGLWAWLTNYQPGIKEREW